MFRAFLKDKSISFKHFIDEIVIDLSSSWHFASIEDIRKNYNPMVGLSKDVSNIKLLNDAVLTPLKLVIKQTASLSHLILCHWL